MTEPLHPPNRIAELRKALELSQEELGKACEPVLSLTVISKLEGRKTPLTTATMRQLAKALGVKASALLVDEDVELRLDAEEAQLIGDLRALPDSDAPMVRETVAKLASTFRAVTRSEAPAPRVLIDSTVLTELAEVFQNKPREEALQLVGVLRSVDSFKDSAAKFRR